MSGDRHMPMRLIYNMMEQPSLLIKMELGCVSDQQPKIDPKPIPVAAIRQTLKDVVAFSVSDVELVDWGNDHQAAVDAQILKLGRVRPPFDNAWVEWSGNQPSMANPIVFYRGSVCKLVLREDITTSVLLSQMGWHYGEHGVDRRVTLQKDMDALGVTHAIEMLHAGTTTAAPTFGKPFILSTLSFAMLNGDGRLAQLVTPPGWAAENSLVCLKAFALCNCKNIEQVATPEPRKEKWHRQKNIPVITFRTLRIKPSPKRAKDGSPSGEPRSSLRAHVVRGHFAEYTAESPRFGINSPEHVGTFWIEQHVRGDSALGAVIKDYAV